MRILLAVIVGLLGTLLQFGNSTTADPNPEWVQELPRQLRANWRKSL